MTAKVQCYVTQLKEKHGTKCTLPQLRFWATMVTTNNHDSLDDPPDMSPFKEKSSLAETISGAALTLAKAARNLDVSE